MAEAPEDNLMTANLFRIDDDEGDPIEMSFVATKAAVSLRVDSARMLVHKRKFR